MRRVRQCTWIVMMLALASCADPSGQRQVEASGDMGWWDKSKSAALEHDLQVFENNFENQVEDTATSILQNSSARGVRLAALTWKTRVLDRLEEKTSEPNAIIALLDTWALTVRQADYLTTGQGKRIFADQQSAAVTTAKQLQSHIEELAAKYIPSERRSKMAAEIREYAQEHPLIGTFEEPAPTSLSTDKNALDTFGDILALPLAPLASAEKFGQGVQDFNVTAAKFTDTIAELPGDTRWQLELLLLNLDTTPAIKSLLESLNKVAASSAAYAEIARTLPGEFQGVLDKGVTKTADETGPLIDKAAWRIAELLLLAFGLAVALVIFIRVTRPRSAKSGTAS